MKKKIIITSFIVWLLLLLNGCTIHFKGKDVEFDAKPPEAKIGKTEKSNQTFELAAVDIL